ncbi:MAG: YihY family inner membrane protein [Pseudomonadota bacterium]|nr:MAG: YihY family inner membrane protein [Pseudomonadota bacterium]
MFHRLHADRCTRVGGELSFTTLLALVPLTTVSVAVLSLFPVFAAWMETAQTFIYGNFVPAAGDAVSQYLQQFAANAGQLTVWGLLFLIITALMLMATIEHAFNDIWHVAQPRKRVHRFLGYWAVLTLGPILIGLSISVTSYLLSLPLVSGPAAPSGVRALILTLAPTVFEVLAFVLMYVVIPNHRVRWGDALIGAIIAAALFEVAKRGFAWFVLSFATYRVIYGALAALPVFLIWIYLSWMVVLLGAVVTATLPEWRGMIRTPRPRRAR